MPDDITDKIQYLEEKLKENTEKRIALEIAYAELEYLYMDYRKELRDILNSPEYLFL